MNELKENLENIKEKLKEQFNQNYPLEKAKELIERIENMDEIEFIEFLKVQNLIEGDSLDKNCVFCAITSKEIPSTIIEENLDAIAILEINPISEGHVLIVPKKHIKETKDFPKKAKDLAEKIAKQIKETFHPEKIEFFNSNITGHEIINILPVYSLENQNSPRNKKTPEELKKIKEKIENSKIKIITPPKPETIKEEKKQEKKEINEKNTWLPKRMLP